MKRPSAKSKTEKRASQPGALLLSGVNNLDLTPAERKRIGRAIIRKNVARDRRHFDAPAATGKTLLVVEVLRRAARRRQIEQHRLLSRWLRQADPDIAAYLEHVRDEDSWPTLDAAIREKWWQMRHQSINPGPAPRLGILLSLLPTLRANGAFHRDNPDGIDLTVDPEAKGKGGGDGDSGSGGKKPSLKKNDDDIEDDFVPALTPEEMDELGWKPPKP